MKTRPTAVFGAASHAVRHGTKRRSCEVASEKRRAFSSQRQRAGWRDELGCFKTPKREGLQVIFKIITFNSRTTSQRGSRLRKKWMKTTLTIPVFRFHVSFWVGNHSVNGGIHFSIVKKLCPTVPTQRVLRYSSPGHCLKRLSMTFCPLALWVGRIKGIWQQRRLPSRSLTVPPSKMMVGGLLSFWDGIFSGASCNVPGRVCNQKII